jgi:hypothetical protein
MEIERLAEDGVQVAAQLLGAAWIAVICGASARRGHLPLGDGEQVTDNPPGFGIENLSGEEAEAEGTQTEHIRGDSRRLSRDLLLRREVRCEQAADVDGLAVGGARVLQDCGDPEVDQLRQSVGRDQHVGGLDVTARAIASRGRIAPGQVRRARVR